MGPLNAYPISAYHAAEFSLKKARAAYFPTLDFVATYGKNYSSGILTMPIDYASRINSREVGVELNMPIFTGGLLSSRVSEALENKYKASAELELARRQAGTDARIAYTGIVNGISKIKALQLVVESGRNAVKGNIVGYRLGIHSNIDVLISEQQLYAAQRDLAKAKYDTLFQGLKLKAAAGILTESDVVEINTLLTDSPNTRN